MIDPEDIRVLVKKEGDHWIAVCLEFFIVAQSDTIDGVEDAFAQAYIAHVVHALDLGRAPFANLGPAPRRYQDAWKGATDLVSFVVPKGTAPAATTRTAAPATAAPTPPAQPVQRRAVLRQEAVVA